MLLDKLLEFDPASTAVTVTADSTNVLDMGVARDMGSAPEGVGTLEVAVYVQTTFAAAGAATLNIQVMGSADNITYATLAESGAIAKGSLVAGARFDIVLPSQVPGGAIPRYYKLIYTVATGPFTAGKVQAELTSGLEHQPVSTGGVLSGYPSGFTAAN